MRPILRQRRGLQAAVGMMAAGTVWLMVNVQEGDATDTFAQYQSTRAEAPMRFEYPAGWEVEASSGSLEPYAQVQVYGPSTLEGRLRTYLVVRMVPRKADGGRYADAAEMASSYRATLQTGLRIDAERPASALGAPATQFDVSGTLLLPWESPAATPVPVKSQRLFLERDGRLYELGWMATPESAPTVADAFAHLLQTLTVAF